MKRDPSSTSQEWAIIVCNKNIESNKIKNVHNQIIHAENVTLLPKFLMKSLQILTINKWATSVLQYPAAAAGGAGRPTAHPVNLSRCGQLTGGSQSQAEDGSTPPNSVVP